MGVVKGKIDGLTECRNTWFKRYVAPTEMIPHYFGIVGRNPAATEVICMRIPFNLIHRLWRAFHYWVKVPSAERDRQMFSRGYTAAMSGVDDAIENFMARNERQVH